jgi:hypothetical protein
MMTKASFDGTVNRLFLAWLREHRLHRPQGAPRLYERSDMLAAYRAGASNVADLALAVLAEEDRK